MHVSSVLKSKGNKVVRIGADATVVEALRLLRQENIGAVVVGGSETSVDGILSERDICRALAEIGAEVLDAPVKDVMTRDVITCTPDSSLEDLMHNMTDHRIRHLPVVQADRLVGIVSIGDVVKYRLDELESERDALRDYVKTS